MRELVVKRVGTSWNNNLNEAFVDRRALTFLPGLEPETTSRHIDVYLKTEWDFWGALWIATANQLNTTCRKQRPRVEEIPSTRRSQPGRGLDPFKLT